MGVMKILVISLMMVSCAKRHNYQTIPKEEGRILNKSSVFLSPSTIRTNAGQTVQDLNVADQDVWLYMPSQGSGPRDSEEIRPYWMGIEKAVILVANKESIDVLELDRDPDKRFNENLMNRKPVISIPVEHVDYRCAENKLEECTGVEEEDKEKPWEQRRFMIPDYSGMQIAEQQVFPIEISNIFSNCYTEKSSRVVRHEVKENTINIEVDKDFRVNYVCESELFSLSELSFTTRYSYSFKRLHKMASKNYKKIEYKGTDESMFGFFDTTQFKVGVDGNKEVNKFKSYLNRWNPDKNNGEVVYHLSPNFYKPKNASTLKATVKAVDVMNKSLKMAKTPLNIKLKKAPEGMSPLDIDSTMIVMVEDPLDSGLIGYGPSLANPYTGEILSARVVMYKGTIERIIKRAYDEFVRESQAVNFNPASPTMSLADEIKPASWDIIPFGALTGESPVQSIPLVAESAKGVDELRLKGFDSLNSPGNSLKIDLSNISNVGLVNDYVAANIYKSSNEDLQNAGNTNILDSSQLTRKINSELTQYNKVNTSKSYTDLRVASNIGIENEQQVKEEKLKSRIYNYSDLNGYMEDVFNFQGTLRLAFQSGELSFVKSPKLKPWIELTDSQKEEILKRLLPYVWTPVLVHEIGHTIGLRHNFGGSEDKANAYTASELKSLDPTIKDSMLNTRRELVSYSSVMDYSYSNLNELPVLGKYDIAALRFAYAREVELVKEKPIVDPATGEVIDVVEGDSLGFKKVKSTLFDVDVADGQRLKNYRFCTDEHAGANPGCNRFDEGSNLREIAQHYVNSYEENYFTRNFRNKRLMFSASSDISYLRGTHNRYFLPLRKMLETYESIINIYPQLQNPEDPLWTNIEFLSELRDAAYTSADFLMNVVRTPSLHCAVAESSNASSIVAIVPIEEISTDFVNCFDIPLQPQFKVVAQVGKHINNMKDPRANHEMVSSIDQIDVRGIWIDKMLAIETLFGRKTGYINFDDNPLQMNYADLPGIKLFTESLLNELILGNVTSVATPFYDQNGNIVHRDNIVSSFQSSHIIKASLATPLNRYYGISSFQDFTKLVIDEVKYQVPLEQGFSTEDEEFYFNLHAYSYGSSVEDNDNVLKHTQKATGKNYFAKENNRVARFLIGELNQVTKVEQVFNSLPMENVIAIFEFMVGQLNAEEEVRMPEEAEKDEVFEKIVVDVTAELDDDADARAVIAEFFDIGPQAIASFANGSSLPVNEFEKRLDWLSAR